MTIFRNFENYKKEIKLASIQNACVEMELYSIVASLIRESKNKCKLSIRDVTSRRKTKISEKYYGESGFPDFIVLDQKFEKPEILGCIEIKRPSIAIDENDTQIKGHLKSFKRVIYTNGIVWLFRGFNDDTSRDIILGTKTKNKEIEWKEQKSWDDLLRKIDTLKWY